MPDDNQTSQFDIGTRIILASVSKQMNADLQRQLGDVGTVIGAADASGKLLIKFDTPKGRGHGGWWISPDRLAPTQEERSYDAQH